MSQEKAYHYAPVKNNSLFNITIRKIVKEKHASCYIHDRKNKTILTFKYTLPSAYLTFGSFEIPGMMSVTR